MGAFAVRKRIWRLSEGQFDNRRPKLEFSTDKVEATGYEGSTLQGDFIIRSTNGIPARGMVYSSNPYMVCQTPQFDGLEVKIRYEVFGEKFQEGDSLDGKFTIVFNQGEEDLPFVVQFISKLPTSSMGEIDSLEKFASLAQNHWNEAMQLFYSKDFAELMKRLGGKEWLLYQGYQKAVVSSRNLEQFLVAVGQKEAITYDLEEKTEEFYQITENQKETIEITKNTWGYIELNIHSDADFVSVEKEKISTDYFLGSNLNLNYYIHKDRMHAGINSARISFDGNNIHKEIIIIATIDEIGTVHKIEHLKRQEKKYRLTYIYEEYRLKRMTTGDWCKETIEIIDELKSGEKEDVWYELMKAQAYITNGQRQEALWIISDMKKAISDKQSVEWAYLLYLCTLIEQEESYVNRLTKEIETIFRFYPDDVRIFWFLLFLREEYCKNSSRKLKAIGQWMMDGCNSPYLYIESYYLFRQDPYLFHSFDEFNLKIMNWARKHHAITKDLAIQIVNVINGETRFDTKIYAILEEAYKVYPDNELLVAIISYLLRGEQYHEKYLKWYEEGIEKELRITGLYEAYMMSIPNDKVDELPQIITMYFQYNSNITYDKKALLYSNIIANNKKNPSVYEQYLRNIELFAMEQMEMGRIDDNLAIIYQNILEMGIINEDVAKAMSKLVFAQKLICLYPNVNRVIIYQSQLENPLVYPVVDNCAYVPVISNEYQVFLEDSYGCLITSKDAYYMEELFHSIDYMDKMRHLAPREITYILDYLNHIETASKLKQEDMHFVDSFLSSNEVAMDYKVTCIPMLIEFLQSHTREEMLESYLMEAENILCLDTNTLGYVIELLITREQYRRAFQLMETHQELRVDHKLLLVMCEQMILDMDFESNDYLISLCGWLLAHEFESTITASYLISYYVGPDEMLLKLWRLSQTYELPNVKLEERLIVQMLYEEHTPVELQEVVDSYYSKKPNKMVVEAYLSLLSHRYLVTKESVPEEIFSYLFMFYQREERLNECCRIALMKNLACKTSLDDDEYRVLDSLVKDAILRNVYFAFYKKMDQRLIVKYHLYDKIFVEYHGNPRERITMVYSIDAKESVEEEMIEMYDGIFVKQFVLFFGETIDYELYSESISDLPIVTEKIVFSDVVENGKENRYDLLNKMQNAYVYFDEKELLSTMKKYQGLGEVTEKMFTII